MTFKTSDNDRRSRIWPQNYTFSKYEIHIILKRFCERFQKYFKGTFKNLLRIDISWRKT